MTIASGNANYWFNTASQKIFEYRLETNAAHAAHIYALRGVAFYGYLGGRTGRQFRIVGHPGESR
jgi:hypothetical protein